MLVDVTGARPPLKLFQTWEKAYGNILFSTSERQMENGIYITLLILINYSKSVKC